MSPVVSKLANEVQPGWILCFLSGDYRVLEVKTMADGSRYDGFLKLIYFSDPDGVHHWIGSPVQKIMVRTFSD